MKAITKWSIRGLALIGAAALLWLSYMMISNTMMGQCVGGQKSPEERITACTRAMPFASLSLLRKFDIHYTLGIAYSRINQLGTALESFDEALKIAPNELRVLLSKADLYSGLRKYEDSIDIYTSAIESAAGRLAYLYWKRANARDTSGTPEEALPDYNLALTLATTPAEHAKYQADRAILYGREKETWDKAIADYNEIIHDTEGLKIKNAAAYRGRGQLEYMKGNNQVAAADYIKAIEQSEDPDETAYMILWAYLAETAAGQDGASNLRIRMNQHKITQWPAPIMKVLLGDISPSEVKPEGYTYFPAIARENATRCELWFYMAEKAQIMKDQTEAKRLYKAVLGTHMTDFTEYVMTQIRMKEM